MSSVSRFFAWCVRHGVLDTAPIAREDIPRPLYTEKEIPTIEEIEKLLKKRQNAPAEETKTSSASNN